MSLAASICLEACVFSQRVLGQVSPDNTLGAESSRVVLDATVAGEDVDLIEGGAVRGTLLFHSFSDFNVDVDQPVYFSNPAAVSDIFSRITGSRRSTINGVLGVDGLANLYFLNPNGIAFGPDAELDLKGSFLASTGDRVLFDNNLEFSATNPQAVPLVNISVPLGVQYGNSPGRLAIGDAKSAGPILSSPGDGTIAFVGGDVNITNSAIATPGGNIEIGAVENNVINFESNGNFLDIIFPEVFSGKSLEIDGSDLSTTPDRDGDGGDLSIVAGSARLINSSSLETSADEGTSGSLSLTILEDLEITDSALYSDTFTSGDGGDLSVRAGSAIISDGSILETSTTVGSAGALSLDILEDLEITDSALYSDTFTSGDGGDLSIRAGSAIISDNSILETSTEGGNAGELSLDINGALSIVESDLISDSKGKGNGGDVSITANSAIIDFSELAASAEQGIAGNLVLDIEDNFLSLQSNFKSISGAGVGGDIVINANDISFLEGSAVDASVTNRGSAGDIRLIAEDASEFRNTTITTTAGNSSGGSGGTGGVINIRSGRFYAEESQLNTRLSGIGNAGNIVLSTEGETRFLNTNFFSDVTGGSVGSGGDIKITTGSLVFEGDSDSTQGFLSSSAGRGNAGNIKIVADNEVELTQLGDGSVAFFSTIQNGGEGRSGDIEVIANSLTFSTSALINGLAIGGEGSIGSIILDIEELAFFSGGGIFNDVVGAGTGGQVIIDAGDLVVENGAQLFTSTAGEGQAGNVLINADNSVVVRGIGQNEIRSSSIFSSSERNASGSGGNITINSPYLLVEDSGVINGRTETSERGGNIVINVETLELTNGGQLVTSTSGTGAAGDIQINDSTVVKLSGINENYNDFLNSPNQRVDSQGAEAGLYAVGAQGIGGNITVSTNQLLIQNQAEISVDSQGAGEAGQIQISSETATLSNGGRIAAETVTSSGGDINLQVLDSLEVDSDSEVSAAAGNGQGGDITITGAQLLSLTDNSNIAVEARSAGGTAGNVTVAVDTLILNNSQLTAVTQASGSGDSANIDLQGLALLLMRNGSQITAQALNDANGGNIDIDSRLVLALPEENSDIIANAVEGNGGSIILRGDRILGFITANDLSTEQLRANTSSDISASSQLGQQGEVVLENLGIDPSQSLVELPTISSVPRVQRDCLAIGQSGISSLTETGQRDLPKTPTDPLGEELALVDLGPESANPSANTTPETTVNPPPQASSDHRAPESGAEAQSWIRDESGRLSLVKQPFNSTDESIAYGCDRP